MDPEVDEIICVEYAEYADSVTFSFLCCCSCLLAAVLHCIFFCTVIERVLEEDSLVTGNLYPSSVDQLFCYGFIPFPCSSAAAEVA